MPGLRILMLLPDSFGGHGGVGQYSRDFIHALVQDPRVTEVVVLNRWVFSDPGPLPSKVVLLRSDNRGLPYYLYFILKYILTCRKTDLIICGLINFSTPAILLKLLYRCECWLILYGTEAWIRPKKWMSATFLRYFDQIVSIGALTSDRFYTWANRPKGENAIIVPCAIDPSKFEPAAEPITTYKEMDFSKKKTILTLARIDPAERYKGHDEILNCMPVLIKQVPQLHYLIAGDGKDRSRLEQKAKDLGLLNNVTFLGRVTDSEKLALYQLADAFVMPSRGEGFGIVYLEALACGLPVLAGKNDGGAEALLHGKLGILVDPLNSEELIEGILKVLEQKKGVVPSGLSHYYFDKFQQRISLALDLLPD